MVLGILGVFCLVAAAATAYKHYGMLSGMLVLAGLSVCTMGGFVVWVFAFPHTPIGRKMTLRKNLVPGAGGISGVPDFLGREGVALTPLRPAGTVRIDGRKVDVVAESDFINAGEAVTVIRKEGMRVVVRKKL
jgi:membrane-bound serine protease (ClpP class)